MKDVLLRLWLRPDLLLVAGRHACDICVDGGCEYCWVVQMAGR